MSGLFQPWSGDVLFDGVPRTQIPRDLIANSLAVVDQEVFLFGGTVGENVTMWDSTVPAQRVSRAAPRRRHRRRHRGARGRIPVDASQEGGGNYSGGQCQRLEITRALVGEPTILILDEATSALDPATEAAIDESLRRRGCTCIIVAHRLSTIRDADEIIVMERGKIVQRGTHEEMKDLEGAVPAAHGALTTMHDVSSLPGTSDLTVAVRVVSAGDAEMAGRQIVVQRPDRHRPRSPGRPCLERRERLATPRASRTGDGRAEGGRPEQR